jgi:hypothetical protein
MKKLYFLSLFLLTSLLGFSQGSINFDDAAKWTQGSAGFTSYSNHTYVDGDFSLACLDVIRNTTSTQDGFPGGLGTYALRLQNDATTEVVFTIANGGVGNFSFSARRWDAAPDTNFAVEFSTDEGTTWTASSTINATVTNDSNWKTISGVINSSNTNIKVRVKSNGTTERLMIDDFAWTSPSTEPSILITSPSNATSYAPTVNSVSINLLISNFNVANGTGDGHIHYTVNGGSIIMKYDTTPIVLSSLTPGTYTVFAELVNNSHASIVPATSATVTFTISSYNAVTNIAALRADVISNGIGRYYQINGEAVVTYARTTRNQKYIQDTSAAILIDDVAGVITNPFNIGDGMTGFKGQTSYFNGLLQIIPLENTTATSNGNTITPEVVTAAAISANIEMYESELVKINGATFTTADGSALFVVNTNNNLNDGTDIVFRTLFAEANYIGQVIPSGAADRVVLVARNGATAQVVGRSNTDISLANTKFEISGLSLTPNPASNGVFYINTDANAERTVTIFDILGKQVLNTTTSEAAINVSSLNAGIYMVKVTEEGKTATKKLVIR